MVVRNSTETSAILKENEFKNANDEDDTKKFNVQCSTLLDYDVDCFGSNI